jgi:hypothetical protein
MSAPSFGWVEILHALSLGIRLHEQDGGGWSFEGSDLSISDAEIQKLLDQKMVESKRGEGRFVEITPEGKRALRRELLAISRRTFKWLNLPPKKGSPRGRQK